MDPNGNSEARIGWGSEFQLEDEPGSGTLVEIEEVTDTLPIGDETADDVEVTHFKSPKKRKEYVRGLIESGTANLVVNYIPGSPTDVLLRKAHADGKRRAFRTILPDADGDPAWQIDGFLYVKSRSRAVQVGAAMKQTFQVRFTGDQDEDEAA